MQRLSDCVAAVQTAPDPDSLREARARFEGARQAYLQCMNEWREDVRRRASERQETRRVRAEARALRQAARQRERERRHEWHAEVARRREEERHQTEAALLAYEAPLCAARAMAREREKSARAYARRKERMAPGVAARKAEREARRAEKEAARQRERATARAARRAIPLKERRRAAWLEMRSGFKCARCAEADPRTIEFHRPGEKHGGVPDLVNRGASLKRVREEIARCEPLCANCHRKHHWSPGRTTADPDRRRYRAWWDEVRAGLRCAQCGEPDPTTFEYLPKTPTAERIPPLVKRSASRDRIMGALEQTLVLCANCRIKAYGR